LPKPCTIRSPSTGSFFDLNPLHLLPLSKDSKPSKLESEHSWTAKGYDYGANFTLNICGPVVEDLDHVEGIKSSMWRNVSAYYMKGKDAFSIGSENSELILRGRKLVLNYTNGSPCGTKHSKRHGSADLSRRRDDDDDEKPTRRKSTTISLLCDETTIDPKGPKVAISFVGTDDDECSYFFEARSYAACAGIDTTPQQQLGPGGVFGVILLIALLVYIVGGCFYQRTVMNQRGWKQLPNYSLWAGIFGFFSDMIIILTSSCTQLIRRRGYTPVSLNGSSRGRGFHSDDENRLIDQLDEEWDD